MEQTTWSRIGHKQGNNPKQPTFLAAESRKRPLNLRLVQKRILHSFSVALHWFEVVIGAICVVFVGLGTAYLIAEGAHFHHTLKTVGLHAGFEELLSDLLLLVVGVELAIMLVRRTPESLVEVMFFVIARKMLIKTGAIYELLIGVVALAGLFAIRKYLEHHPPARTTFAFRPGPSLIEEDADKDKDGKKKTSVGRTHHPDHSAA